MRILYVHNINRVAEIYGSNLAQCGHTVTVYEPSLVGGNASLPTKLALMPWRVLSMYPMVGNLNPKHFDLVHVHWASYGVLGLVSRIPFIVHCHGSDVRYRLRQPFFRSLLGTILQRAAAVMCITPDLLPIVQSVRSDVVFFPVPIDTEQFAPKEDKLRDLSHPWTILLFARLDAIKGVDTAIRGIVRFVQRYSDVRVLLLEWGDLKEHYKQQYGKDFEFIPPVAPNEVSNLIRSADVVVGQFAVGALGLSELQAMSCAKPVICSFRYEEAYSTPPPLCQATTAEEIEEHLENLFQHPGVGIALGQKAREWVIKNHDHRDLSVKLERFYQSIL
jgi:glycosyltransferase involved in cell wall biosynthesis